MQKENQYRIVCKNSSVIKIHLFYTLSQIRKISKNKKKIAK